MVEVFVRSLKRKARVTRISRFHLKYPTLLGKQVNKFSVSWNSKADCSVHKELVTISYPKPSESSPYIPIFQWLLESGVLTEMLR